MGIGLHCKTAPIIGMTLFGSSTQLIPITYLFERELIPVYQSYFNYFYLAINLIKS